MHKHKELKNGVILARRSISDGSEVKCVKMWLQAEVKGRCRPGGLNCMDMATGWENASISGNLGSIQVIHDGMCQLF